MLWPQTAASPSVRQESSPWMGATCRAWDHTRGVRRLPAPAHRSYYFSSAKSGLMPLSLLFFLADGHRLSGGASLHLFKLKTLPPTEHIPNVASKFCHFKNKGDFANQRRRPTIVRMQV